MGWTSETFPEIEELIITKLRDGYPFMKLDAVHEAAKAATELVQSRVAEQGHAIQLAKSRNNFLTFSAEIRNRIYAQVLTPSTAGSGGIEKCLAIAVNDKKTCLSEWVAQPALCRTSRQIRKETLPIFYGINNFVLSMHAAVKELDPGYHQYEFRLNAAQFWLQQIGPENVKLIKHVDVCFNGNDVLHLGVDEQAFHRDLDGCLEHYGAAFPPETKFLAHSLGVNHPHYWQLVEFGVGRDAIIARPRAPLEEKSLFNRTVEE